LDIIFFASRVHTDDEPNQNLAVFAHGGEFVALGIELAEPDLFFVVPESGYTRGGEERRGAGVVLKEGELALVYIVEGTLGHLPLQ
jgi:hypothetical protein